MASVNQAPVTTTIPISKGFAFKAVGIRTAIFLTMLAVSIPLAYPVGVWLLGLLPAFDMPATAFWHTIDDLVFDLPIKWPMLAMAPIDLVARGSLNVPMLQFIALSCVGWIPIAVLYSWLTRKIRLRYVVIGVYPVIWILGIAIGLLLSNTVGSSFDGAL